MNTSVHFFGIPISQFFNSGFFFKTFLTRIFGIRNGSGILLPMGVPEIGTKNQNSQPRRRAVAGDHPTTEAGDNEQQERAADDDCWKLQATTQPIHVYWHSGSL